MGGPRPETLHLTAFEVFQAFHTKHKNTGRSTSFVISSSAKLEGRSLLAMDILEALAASGKKILSIAGKHHHRYYHPQRPL